jgi:glycosyltransferase involved in cell wall biosynthesis
LFDVQRDRTLVIANPAADVYGSDLQMLESITAMIDRHWNVIVTSPDDGPLVEMVRERGATLRFFTYPVLRRADASAAGTLRLAANGARSIAQIRRLLKEIRPDVVYVNSVTLPWWPAACVATRTPVVVHVHEAEESDGAVVRYALNAPLTITSALIFNGRPALDATTRLYPFLARRSHLIYNGIPDPGPKEPLPDYGERPFRLVNVGRLSPRKGTDVALDAVGELRGRGHDVQLEVCGSPFSGYEWYEDELKARAAREDLAGAVTFSGYVSPVAPALNRAHAVLAPSLREPFGNAVVEAQLMGRPVVAAAAMGHLETVQDGETGVLVEAGSPRAMADAVEGLMQEPERAARIGRAGQRRAHTEYSLDRYSTELASVLEDLAGGARRRKLTDDARAPGT